MAVEPRPCIDAGQVRRPQEALFCHDARRGGAEPGAQPTRVLGLGRADQQRRDLRRARTRWTICPPCSQAAHAKARQGAAAGTARATCSRPSAPLAARHSTTSTKRSGSFSGDRRTQLVSSVRAGAGARASAGCAAGGGGSASGGGGIWARSLRSAGSRTCGSPPLLP